MFPATLTQTSNAKHLCPQLLRSAFRAMNSLLFLLSCLVLSSITHGAQVCSGDDCTSIKRPAIRQLVNQCQNDVSVDISFVADDGVILYICGTQIRQSSNFDEQQTFRYEGPCGDFMLEVENRLFAAGVALLATYNGQKYGTTDNSGRFSVEGTVPLTAISTFQPSGNWFLNEPNFDFSSWTRAVVVESLLGIGNNFNLLAAQGAYPINVRSGNVAIGTYGLKLFIPFCICQ